MNTFYSSIFGDLTKNVQIRFDAVSELNKRLNDQVIYEKYLKWDVPSIGLDFEEIIGSYNITIAAPTIGENSKEPIVGTEGFATIKERILNHALTLPMTMQEYRKVMQILDSKMLPDKAKTQQLVDLMWGNVMTVVNAVQAKLDVLFLRGLSNEGKITLGSDNNPEGGVQGLIDFNQPAANIATATTPWTAANSATVDCFEDIQGIMDAAQDKVVFDKILCAPSRISYICRSANVKKMIWGSDRASRLVTIADLNAYMSENGFPTFEPMRRQVRIQNNGTVTTYNPWNEKNLVFVPAGNLGVIKNAYANPELKPEPGVTYSNYGRILVSQWGAGEAQGSNGVEFTKAQVYALPVITEMGGIFTLKTES